MKKYIISLILLIPFMVSCNDWLDILPKEQMLEEELLTNSQGYSGALAGAYFAITDHTMFGGRLTYSDLDVLGQYWIPRNSDTQSSLVNYDYKFNNADTYFGGIWSKLYEIIGTANLIIASIEKNGSSIEHADLIEGEAVGIRAFIHFELFRLFGPVLLEKEDFSKECIIYRKEFNAEYVDFTTVENVLSEIKSDLLRAKELLKDDPIRISGGRSDDNPSMLSFNDILYYRVSRMNYYAVVGLLIRLEMYLNNKDQAFIYIEELFEELKEKEDMDNHIKFVDVATMLSSKRPDEKDVPFSSEFLFSIYNNDLYLNTKGIFGNQGTGEGSLALNSLAFSYMSQNVYAGVKAASASDIRYKCWFKHESLINGIHEIQKFLPAKMVYVDSSSPQAYAYQTEIGYITLGEIYLTAFECQIGKNNKSALQYLNTLRKARNLELLDINTNYTEDELMEHLLIESKKEYLASGRLFHLHKRLFKPLTTLNGRVVQPSREIFELPIPTEEEMYKN